MQTKDILERLIAYETISSMSNMALIEFVQKLLQDAGADVVLIKNTVGTKANLYATIGPKDRAGVLLSGHTDVVPVEGQAWTVQPFELTEKDMRFYGRGTADMKGFLACALSASLSASKKELINPLHLAFSYDEEIGCVGVRSMIEMLKNAPFKPLFCIVGEPTGMSVATGHKGKLSAQATCIGLEAHSALAPFGLNAIHLATDFVASLRDIQENLKNSITQDDGYDVPYSTIHVGKINGGVALNIVPNRCVVDFEIRNIAADNADEIFERIEKAAEVISKLASDKIGVADISIKIKNAYPSLDTNPNAEIIQFMKSLTGANATSKVSFGTEGGLFSERLNIPTVICGPGSMAQGHKPDEFVTCQQIDECDEVLAKLLDRLIKGL